MAFARSSLSSGSSGAGRRLGGAIESFAAAARVVRLAAARTAGARDVEATLAEARVEASHLPNLMIAAARLAGSVPGGHGRRRSGPGSDFWQFRPYAWGDPATAIDWRQSARFEQIQVREREWQAPRNLMVWLDPSASMRWGSAPQEQPTKRERAEVLLLALSILALEGGEAVALMREGARPAWGRGVAQRLALSFAEKTAAEKTAADEADGDAPTHASAKEEGLPPPLTPGPHTHVVLCGDFLDATEPLRERIRTLASRGAGGTLLQVLDPAERDLPWQGGAVFVGPEGEAPYTARRVEDLRERYRERLAEQTADVQRVAETFGWRLLRHGTEAPPLTALVALHQRLSFVPGSVAA